MKARSQDLAWQKVGGEVVILDLRSQSYLSLNHSGAMLWPLLVAGTSRPALAAALIAAYHLDEDAADRDVNALLAQLAEAGLLEETGDAYRKS